MVYPVYVPVKPTLVARCQNRPSLNCYFPTNRNMHHGFPDNYGWLLLSQVDRGDSYLNSSIFSGVSLMKSNGSHINPPLLFRSVSESFPIDFKPVLTSEFSPASITRPYQQRQRLSYNFSTTANMLTIPASCPRECKSASVIETENDYVCPRNALNCFAVLDPISNCQRRQFELGKRFWYLSQSFLTMLYISWRTIVW